MATATLLTMQPKAGDAIAYYGRVSTKKQKLEHQREYVQVWTDDEGIHIPKEWHYEDKEKRHKSAERENFQRLLELARSGALDWIVIASFERWGVADVDEFFEFRRQLKDAGVRLWSVQDRLELTGCNDFDYQRIINLAISHTMNMAHHAEQNIRKMLSMARHGFHASKEHPYGTDLLCCRLDNQQELFRVQLISKDLERKGPRAYKIAYPDGRSEVVGKMPPRDCKTSGYRLAPSTDLERIENVKLVYELFDQGLTNREISNRMQAMGRTYFGKLFGAHAIDSILRNPAYIGMPAWGKTATGQYRQVFDKTATKPTPRKKTEPKTYDKGEANYVYPDEPVYDPEAFIPKKLWDRVQSKLKAKPKRQTATRRRSKTIHPLNGLLVCPDCGRRMVVNNTSGRQGQRINYFICGAYCKSGKTVCRPNSIRFSKVDEAMRLCWENVSQALGDLAKLHDGKETLSLEKLISENSMSFWQTALVEIIVKEMGCDLPTPEEFKRDRKGTAIRWAKILGQYQKRAKASQSDAGKRLEEVEVEINQIGDLLEKTPSETLKKRWYAKLEALEQEKGKLAAGGVSLLDKLLALAEHGTALEKTLAKAKLTKEAQLWDTFVERVVPVMEDLPFGSKTQRTATAFRFEPKTSVFDMLGSVLDIDLIRRDTALFQHIARLFSQTVYVGKQKIVLPPKRGKRKAS